MFDLQARNTSVRTELVAGASTFMTMSYIIFVQPALLAQCGMDYGAVLVATCVASAIATVLMGTLANYPIALAPAMGHNVFFVFTVCIGMGYSWQEALGVNFISGALFVALSLFSFRARLVEAIPQSLKSAIAVGIGLLIALLGLEWSGIIVGNPNTLVTLGDLHAPPVLLSLFGLLLISTLFALRVRGAILIGIIAVAFGSWLLNLVEFDGIVGMPEIKEGTFLKLDVLGAIRTRGPIDFLSILFVFFFLDLFDTVGTLVGISERAGLLVDGKLPRAERALLSDAVGTVVGTTLGTSTVTSYIESASGVAEGGRTGLANVVTAALFLLAIFFYPLARMVGGRVEYDGLALYPAIAPPLIIVGSMMMTSVKSIDWEDYTESVPAFLTLIVMPLTFSITEGIAFGFISYALLKLLSGRGKEVNAFVYVFAALFVLRYAVGLG